uniref:ES1, mitochondrial n=1 Tax=Lygus hesperus TaxID=30085 RepID=A0A0A9YA09_LYGHE
MKYACFAPDAPMLQVVDHSKGEPDSNEVCRNMYKESARIARGKILPLHELHVDNFDALIIPGGFGIAKNFSNFVDKGYEMNVIPSVKRVMCDFHDCNKPIACICIAPIIAASIFRDDVAVTVGGSNDDSVVWPFHGTAHAVEAMGAKHIDTTLQQVCIDRKSNVLSCPAYMCGTAKPHQVHENIGMLVSALRDQILHSL